MGTHNSFETPPSVPYFQEPATKKAKTTNAEAAVAAATAAAVTNAIIASQKNQPADKAVKVTVVLYPFTNFSLVLGLF